MQIARKAKDVEIGKEKSYEDNDWIIIFIIVPFFGS